MLIRRFILCWFAIFSVAAGAQQAHTDIQLERPVHAWDFLDAVGTRAGLFGSQDGKFEAWVYPLKLLRDFRLVVRTSDGRELDAHSLARSITVRPESSTITYAGDNFQIRETWFVPVDEPGAVIELEIQTSKDLHVEARFRRDLQLMWPAGLGGTWQEWDASLHAFVFGEETKKYFGVIGAEAAERVSQEFDTNYASSSEDVLQLPPVTKPGSRQLIVISGSSTGRKAAEQTLHKLAAEFDSLRQSAAAHYTEYLARTPSIDIPDAAVQRAYDWARISMAQGMINDPLLGTGLIAGYRTSGSSARPGFAWFFGRDSEWTSFALDSIGDFSDVRTALEFLMKFQRKDGKVEHEIPQTTSLVPWFADYQYGYASADATPLLLIAVREYAHASGDVGFVREHWDNLSRAYSFLRSTWDAEGHAKNTDVGHGWIEGGPLLPVKTELYQSGLSAEASRSMADLARVAGHADLAGKFEAEAEHQRQLLDRDFWSDSLHAYAFALDKQNTRLETASVLTTVPMWFGLLEPQHADATINVLAQPEHMADWGMRIISDRDSRYDAAGYHYGSVWPLFTGWASVGEYRYHRALPAFANLKANALITLGTGRTTEVLSGAYFEQLSTSSPHQIWSSAMVVSPILRGMMGLSADAAAHTLTFAPHLPADWTAARLRNVSIGSTRAELSFTRTSDEISLDVQSSGELHLRFSPAISPRAQVLDATLDGRRLDFHVENDGPDQHVNVDVPRSEHASIKIRVQNDFGIAMPFELPPPGHTSRGVRVISEKWNAARNEWQLQLAGHPGMTYDFPLRGAEQLATVEGGALVGTGTTKALHVSFAEGTEVTSVVLKFRDK